MTASFGLRPVLEWPGIVRQELRQLDLDNTAVLDLLPQLPPVDTHQELEVDLLDAAGDDIDALLEGIYDRVYDFLAVLTSELPERVFVRPAFSRFALRLVGVVDALVLVRGPFGQPPTYQLRLVTLQLVQGMQQPVLTIAERVGVYGVFALVRSDAARARPLVSRIRASNLLIEVLNRTYDDSDQLFRWGETIEADRLIELVSVRYTPDTQLYLALAPLLSVALVDINAIPPLLNRIVTVAGLLSARLIDEEMPVPQALESVMPLVEQDVFVLNPRYVLGIAVSLIFAEDELDENTRAQLLAALPQVRFGTTAVRMDISQAKYQLIDGASIVHL